MSTPNITSQYLVAGTVYANASIGTITNDTFDSLYLSKGFLSPTNNWFSATVSGIDNLYQEIYDQALFNNLNLISNNIGLQKLKDYELEFKKTSAEFYSLWNNGDININQKTYDWAGTYKNLILQNSI